MCGRYTLMTDEEYGDIRRIIQDVQDKVSGAPVKTGEVFPTNLAPVLVAEQAQVVTEAAIWGFPNFRNKGVIINARAETAPEKPMFRKPLLTSRCVVPTTGFFEWDKEKRKYLFQLQGTEELYLAGLCNDFKGERRYTILTTAPNESIINVHNRMPVIVPKNRIEEWLMSTDAAVGMMTGKQPELVSALQS